MAVWYSPSGTAWISGKSHRGKRFGEIPKRFRENTFRQIVSTQFGEMLRRGKMNRRRQRLFPPAPDFLYKAASFEPYNSAKYPEKPLATGAFCLDGVKNSLPELYQFLVGMVAEAVGFEPTCPLGQPHFECGSLRPLRYASTGADCGKQDDPDDESSCSDGGATRI